MNIIVVGCGRVGSHLATLLSDDGHNVCVVDRRPDAFAELGHDFNGRTLKGVGFDVDVLSEAGALECDVVAAVTSNDNANLMISEVARRVFGIKHVITRLYSPKREKTYTQLGIDFACGTTLVAEDIFAKIQAGHGHHVDTFGDFELIRFALDFEDADATVTCASLERAYGARVVVYEHNDQTYMPSGNSVLHDGDVIMVCISRSNLTAFSEYLAGGNPA